MDSTISRPGPISAPRAQPPIPAPEPYFPPSGDSFRLHQRSIAADRSRTRSRHLKTRSRGIRSNGDITVSSRGARVARHEGGNLGAHREHDRTIWPPLIRTRRAGAIGSTTFKSDKAGRMA